MPQLATTVKPAIERSIQEMMVGTIEKAMKLSVTTTEQVVRKDFALDSDEFRMQSAAHKMAQNLAAGMSLTYAREQLLTNIVANLKNTLIQHISTRVCFELFF